jgi:methylglyoxal synthase
MEPNVISTIANREVDLIINIPRSMPTGNHHTDGFKIRRLAIDHHIPLITNIHLAQLFLHCLSEIDLGKLPVKSLQEYVRSK